MYLSTIEKRNKRILNFFSTIGYKSENIRLINAETDKPSIIFENELVLSCFISGFFINLTSKARNSEIVGTFKLRNEYNFTTEELNKIINWCKTSEHNVIFKIMLQLDNDSVLYLTEDKNNDFQFGLTNPKIFFNRENCENVIQRIYSDELFVGNLLIK